METLVLNAAANDAAANKHLDLTIQQRAALEKLIDTNRTSGEKGAAVANKLNLKTFDYKLEDGSKVSGMGRDICDIYKGPNALSNYLIN